MPTCQSLGCTKSVCVADYGCKTCGAGSYSTKLAAGWRACRPCLEGCKACADATTCTSCAAGFTAVSRKGGGKTCQRTPPPSPKQKPGLRPLPEADPCCAQKLTVQCFAACRCCVDGDGYVPWRNCRACDAAPPAGPPASPAESPAPRPDGYNPCCDPLSKVMCFAACRTCAEGDGFVAGVNCTAAAPPAEELPCCPPVLRMDQPPCRDCGFRGL